MEYLIELTFLFTHFEVYIPKKNSLILVINNIFVLKEAKKLT